MGGGTTKSKKTAPPKPPRAATKSAGKGRSFFFLLLFSLPSDADILPSLQMQLFLLKKKTNLKQRMNNPLDWLL